MKSDSLSFVELAGGCIGLLPGPTDSYPTPFVMGGHTGWRVSGNRWQVLPWRLFAVGELGSQQAPAHGPIALGRVWLVHRLTPMPQGRFAFVA